MCYLMNTRTIKNEIAFNGSFLEVEYNNSLTTVLLTISTTCTWLIAGKFSQKPHIYQNFTTPSCTAEASDTNIGCELMKGLRQEPACMTAQGQE